MLDHKDTQIPGPQNHPIKLKISGAQKRGGNELFFSKGQLRSRHRSQSSQLSSWQWPGGISVACPAQSDATAGGND